MRHKKKGNTQQRECTKIDAGANKLHVVDSVRAEWVNGVDATKRES
jgi:hypothetical protein